MAQGAAETMNVNTRVNAVYDEKQIQVLEGLEAVRKRPGMYIGSTDTNGLHHLVYEIVDNSIDEALAGYCRNISITLRRDGSVTVEDDGRGFPVGLHPKLGRPAVEVCLTVLHAGGKFGGEGYKVSGGLHGVGASVVNALSKHMEVLVYQNGKVYQQEYDRGHIAYDLRVIGETGVTGTTVRFWPDIRSEQNPDGVFEPDAEFRWDTLKSRVREMAVLNKGIRLDITDERAEPMESASFCYEGGIAEFVRYINKNRVPLHPDPILVEGERNGTSVEIALQYNDSYQESVFAFANNVRTPEGGTHLVGFYTALTRAVNDYGRRFKILKEADGSLKGDDVRESLAAVVSVKLREPQFEGQTKAKLGNSEVRGIVDSLVYDRLAAYLEENPSVAHTILDRCLGAARAREAARKARELTRRK